MTTRRKPSAALTKIMTSLDEDTLRRTRDRMLLAGYIADVLQVKGLSQRKFAEMLGKSESEISELLSGNRNFGLDTLSDISDCLKVDLLQLSVIPTKFISGKDVEVKHSKTRKPKVYDMNEMKTVHVSKLAWQSYTSSKYCSLAL